MKAARENSCKEKKKRKNRKSTAGDFHFYEVTNKLTFLAVESHLIMTPQDARKVAKFR